MDELQIIRCEMIKTSTWSTVRKIKNQGNKELVNLTVKSIIIDKETICSWLVHLTLRNQKHKLNPVEESNKESSCQIKKSRRNRSNQIISNLQSKLRRWEENLSLSRGLSLCVSTMTKLRNWKWKRGREVEEKKKEKWFGFGLMWGVGGGEKRPIMSREIFVFFNFEKTNKRENLYFSFFVWVENRTSTKALFTIGLLRFCHLKPISLLLQILVIAVKLSFDCCRYYLRFCHFSLSLFFFSLCGGMQLQCMYNAVMLD